MWVDGGAKNFVPPAGLRQRPSTDQWEGSIPPRTANIEINNIQDLP